MEGTISHRQAQCGRPQEEPAEVAARVTPQAPRRSRGNVFAIFEDPALHMHHHLVAIACRAGQREFQELVFILRRGNTDLLAGGTQSETGTPAEPVGTGAEAMFSKVRIPASAGVELPDQYQQPIGGCLEVGRDARQTLSKNLVNP